MVYSHGMSCPGTISAKIMQLIFYQVQGWTVFMYEYKTGVVEPGIEVDRQTRAFIDGPFVGHDEQC